MQITFAQFLSYLLCTDVARLDCAHSLVRAEPPMDTHKDIRTALVDIHRRGLDPMDASSYGSQDGPPETIPSPTIIAGHQAFLRSAGEVSWFEPPYRPIEVGPLTVGVDPEMGLTVNGVPHVIKLYLSRDPLVMGRRAMTLALMGAAFSRTWPGVTFGVLDVRRGKLHTHPDKGSTLHPKLLALMTAEAYGLHELWTELQGRESAKARTEMEAFA